MPWKTWAIAALLTLAMMLCVDGCTVVHVHIGDTAVDAEAEVGFVVPTPKVVLPGAQ